MVDKAREFLCSSVSIFGRSVKKGIILLVALLLVFAIKVCNNTPDYSNVNPSYYGTFYGTIDCYYSDREKAEELYNGKIVELAGSIKRIDKDKNDDGAKVYFAAYKELMGREYLLRVFVTKENLRELEKFRPNAIVAFRGKCYGSYDKESRFYIIDLKNAYMAKCFPPHNPVGLQEYIENIPLDKHMLK